MGERGGKRRGEKKKIMDDGVKSFVSSQILIGDWNGSKCQVPDSPGSPPLNKHTHSP